MKTLLLKRNMETNYAWQKCIMFFGLLIFTLTGHAQLLQQDFASSTTVSSYVNASPSNGQFNAISTSGGGTVLSINTTGSNKLRYARTGNAGAFSRTTDFSPTPSSMMYRFDLAVSGNSTAVTNLATWQVGAGFGTGNSGEANAAVHSRIGLNWTTTAGQFSLRNIVTSTNTANYTGTQTVTWVINNSGATLTYKSPSGTYETVANDTFDLWIGTTREFNDAAATTGSQALTDLKFAISNGSGNVDMDNFLITPVPAVPTSAVATAITPTGFDANWSTVSGVTGYRIDVATDAAFTSLVSGYDNLYVAGQATNTLAVTGLSSTTQYWYRVRAASQYTVGEFAGDNSSSETLTTTTASGIDGVISANEYGTHTDGNNQQSSATGTWYMTWDATNLYIAATGGSVSEAGVLYLDKDALSPVNGGSNSDGNLVGQNYDGSNFANLQFRADMVVYFKSGYNEYRLADGSGGWGSAVTTSTSATAGTTREIAIPWSALGGKPASFNWFGYLAYSGGGAYASVPTENPGSGSGTTIGSSARWDRYYTVSDTTVGSGTMPFSRNSYTFTSSSDISNFGAISAYDFTMNSSGLYISRSGSVSGDWTIGGNLTMGNGTIYLGSGGSGYGQTNIAGNLNLLGGSFNMDQTDASMNVDGNVSIASGASLILSGISGGDLSLKGNFSNSGTFTPNSRATTFNGTVAQSITGATTFSYLTLNNATGLTLNNAIAVSNDLTLTSGKVTLGANNLTVSGAITSSATNYVVTNSTGQLRQTVSGSDLLFPVGNSVYNPITFNNSGTADIYGVNVLDGTFASLDNTKVVNRRWQVTEAVSGGSNLAVVGQYNSGEPAVNFAAGTNPKIGFYDGSAWSEVGATAAGADPFTYTSTANHTPTDLTTGTQYFALGKDNAFASIADRLVITAITPSSPTQDSAFTVTVGAQDSSLFTANVVVDTDFTLTTNGNAGVIGGTVTGTILAGTSSIIVSGVLLDSFGTGVTITATRTAGDVLTAATSSTFTVLAKATDLVLVGVPTTGNIGSALTTFTVEARRADTTVDTNFTGSITITQASGPGTLSGTTSVAAVAGEATFSNIIFDTVGTVTLTASATGVTSDTSGNIVMSLLPVSIFENTITGTNPNTSNPYTTGQTFDTNITVSGIERGTGITGTNANNRYTANGWDSGSFDADDYFSMTLTPNIGYSINFEDFDYTGQASGTGPTSFAVRSSLDNFGSDIATPGATGATVSLSSASFDDITSAITFRIYGYGASNSGGTFSVNDFVFNGNVLCVQPVAYTVTGGGAYCTGGSGVAVGLSDSQVGVSYQLQLDSVDTGSPVAGDGDAITFGDQTGVGTYTVIAENTYGSCNYTNVAMTGSVDVTVSTSTTWTGGTSTTWTDVSNWSCVVPTSTSDVIISTASFYPEITTNVTINSLTIDSGATLKVVSGHNLTVTDAIDNEGTLTVENDANLKQVSDLTNTGSGSTIVKRDTATLMRQDYVMWSSPVSGQQLQAFSPQTLPTRFNTFDGSLGSAGQYVAETATNNFSTGVGYLIRMPNNHPATPTVWNGTFTGGNAHNGTIAQTGLTSDQYYAIGNPYPSTIDADLFIAGNSLTDAMYFWRKTNNSANPSYATYTLAGGVGTANSADPLGLEPDGTIAVGQGFIVKTGSTSLTFDNDMRTTNNSSIFFRTTNADRSRIWLNLSTASGVFCQTLVSYMENATSGIDNMIDGRFLNDTENAITSIINDEEFSIQGRALPFDAEDVVPLGFKCDALGDYSIGIDHMDGFFNTTSEDIYLKDNLTNTVHDLRVSPYTFSSEAGVYNSRFELRYQNLLSVEQPVLTNTNVVVYKQNQALVVNTGKILMSKVQIYDIRGRLLTENSNVNASEVRMNVGTTNQVLLVKITSVTNEVVTKKVMN